MVEQLQGIHITVPRKRNFSSLGNELYSLFSVILEHTLHRSGAIKQSTICIVNQAKKTLKSKEKIITE